MPAHKLELEHGRFFDIDRSERICKHCSLGNVEYTFHFILICPFYERMKEKHIEIYYYKKPSALKLIQLPVLSTENVPDLRPLGKYLYVDVQSLIERKTHLYVYSNYY